MLSFLSRLFGPKRNHEFERAVRQVFDFLASQTKQLDALESFVFQVE
jgi:hypothetical protein